MAKRSVRAYAMDCLARREMSRYELIQRMLRAEYPQDAVEAEVDTLREERLQSDARFVEAYVASRVRRGDGPTKIRFQSHAKRVSPELVEAALSDPEYDWQAIALQAVQKRYAGTDFQDREQRAKIYQYLLRKGHDPAMIHSVLAALLI
jgi:regulatory protein